MKTPDIQSQDPRTEYTRRLEMHRTESNRQERVHLALGNLRLAVFVTGAVIAWLAVGRGLFTPWWLLLPVILFTFLIVVHERVIQARRLSDRAARFYEAGLDRLDHHWAGKGEAGERFLHGAHPYAEDLDLFGRGGLFELLCTARIRAGEETLAAWLLSAASVDEIRARQVAVEELRSKLDLREDLAVLGEDVRSGVNAEAPASWGDAPPVLASPLARISAAILAVFTVLSLILWSSTDIRAVFLGLVILDAAFGLSFRVRVRRVISEVEHPAHELALLSQVLVRLERERFETPRLVELRAALNTEGLPASGRIAKLDRLVELLDSRDNVALRLVGPLVLWSTQIAFAIEAWRKVSGPETRRWLAAIGEIEALCALAGYSYEHPADPFPEFQLPGSDHQKAWFEGEGLGHPLLPEAQCVRNDVRLGGEWSVLIVSGSNMSGKSTLLRTVGANAVLAMAGAPVRARRLLMSPLAVGASVRITDSLQAGTSRFYAEITRLRRVMDLTEGPLPVLFLLDELLHGTNSHDRRIGAEAIIRGLIHRNAIGLVTTHDLALANIAEYEPHAGNFHFEDHFEQGKMTFDYQLRPGVVRKSNALELMRSVGLDV